MRSRRLPRYARLAAAAAAAAGAACLAAGFAPAVAQAEGSPAIALRASSSAEILIGSNATITLEATNPAGQPYGYNLSYRAILPKGVSLVAGSSKLGSGGAAPAPSAIANEPGTGETTLIWSNVGDLSPASQNTLSFAVTPATSSYAVGSTFSVEAGAYIASQARFLPTFSATGVPQGPSSESFTASATGKASTTISAIEISQSTPEAQILRGVHDHQTVYTITVTNNSVNPTTGVTLEDWLPAALEYLGCGGPGSDHTTDAPTNPGSSEEYPGSGPIEVAALAGCKAPEIVETVEADPDGGGEDPAAVYTHLRWSLGTLAAGETRTYEFRAAVPLRENTLTWTGTEPSAASGLQAANLNNNSGKETRDGESLITFAEVGGEYDGSTPVSASDHLTRVAKDLTTEKSESSKVLSVGQVTEWTITLHSSEYRYNTQVEVEDTLPDGLCPLDSTNLTSSEECEPDRAPSSPFAGASEEEAGTWKLTWNETTDAALADLEQNATTTTTYFTKTRSHYQSGHAAGQPILAHDSLTNSALASATANVVCAGDTNCSGESKQPIDHERALSESVSDGASASQSGEGPTIAKKIAESGTDCLTDAYTTATPVYHPGDLVCWLLEASFPQTLSTHGTAITDFLPVADSFDEAFDSGKGEAATAADTLPGTSFEHSEASAASAGGAIKWTLPESGFVGEDGQRFQRVYATIAGLPGDPIPGELQGNLMKFASINTGGESFALRAEANYTVQFPELSLSKDIVAIGGKAYGPATSAVVKGGQEVEFAVTASNSGEQEASGAEIWDLLPDGLECTQISAISAGGSCASGRISWGDAGLGESAVDVAAQGATTLRFTVKVPASINPATALEDHAGIVEYHSETNVGGEYTYVPAENIDPTLGLEANVPAADAHALLETEAAKLEKTHTSSVVETGNSASQATIGELVTFEVSATIPAGTTLSGEARITDPGIPTERLSYEKGSAEALVNGAAAPSEFKVEEAGASPVLIMPDDYAPSTEVATKVTLRFKTRVANVKENNAAGSSSEKNISNTGKLAWTNPVAGPETVEADDSVALVEPSLKLSQSNNAGGKPVHGGQLVEYTLELSNASGASSAFENKIVDTVPTNITPCNSKGEALKNGEATASGGTWDEGAHTITWEIPKLEGSAHHSEAFFGEVNEEPVSATSLTNKALATTSSMESESSARTASNAPTAGIKARYEAESKASLEVEGASVTKESNSPTATIGHRITYTLTVTLPAHVVAYDETVIDTLPDSLDFDEYAGEECSSGCPPEAAPEVHAYKPVIEAGSTKVGWDLGNLAATSSPRTIKIHYVASVRATHRNGGAKIEAPATVENSATLYYNKTEKSGFEETKLPGASSFDKANGPVSAKTTVVEPKLTLVKELSVDGGAYSSAHASLTDGDSLGYRLTVSNTGTSPAYDVVVTDKPPATLEEVTATEGSADVTKNGDGEIAWKIAGPLAAGSSVKLAYTAKLAPVASLEAGEAVDNEAKVPSYFGASEEERAEGLENYAKEAIVYREYAGPSTQVTATVALPTITVEKTTGASGFPTSADAEVKQPFSWRVIVKNTSTVAAKNLRVADRLPANWEYVAKSASFSPGGAAEPSESGSLSSGRELVWQTKIELEAGHSAVLTYQAEPDLEAEQSPGTGEHNPNTNSASASVEDLAGHSADASGPFAAGPATAQGVLVVPKLEVSKKATDETLDAGAADSYLITVHNGGAGTAREVIVADTMPSGMTYTPKTATASPSAGFSEQSATSSSATWEIERLGAGATVEITVPIATASTLAEGTTLENKVAVHSVEEPEAVEASGEIKFRTAADLEAKKRILSGADAVPGTHMAYEVSATDNGPSVSHSVELVDHLPTGVEYVSAQAGCSELADVVTCSRGELAVGETAAFEIVVALPSSLTGTIRNSVEAKSATFDPEPANNTATVSAQTHPTAELKLAKVALTPEVFDGQEARFELTASNQGPSDAAEAKIIDTLPEGLTYKGATGASCSASGQTVTCQLGTLTAGAEDSVELTAATAGARTVVNTATLTSGAEDPEPRNNTAEATLEILPVARLTLEKTASAPLVKLPGQVSYTLLVHDEGPDPASEVLVSDPLPAGETYVSNDAGCGHEGQSVTCRLATLANGGSWTIRIVTALGANVGRREITNTASVSSPTHDPSAEGLRAQATISTEPVAGLVLEKLALTPEVLDSQDARFELNVTNYGPSEASEARIVDTLPAGMTYLSASGASCSSLGQAVTCELGTLADGQAASVELTVATTTPGIDVNHAEAVSSAEAPEGAADKAEATVKVLPGAALQIEKTASPTVVKLPGRVTYAVTVQNNGPDPAEEVQVTDPLPAGESFVSAGAGCTDEGQTVRCEIGELADGARSTIDIVAAFAADAGRHTFTNTAQVASATGDPNGAGGQASAAVETIPVADLKLVKLALTPQVLEGQEARFRLTATNAGPSEAPGTQIVDTLPAGMTYTNATGASCSSARQLVTCELGTLADDREATVELGVSTSTAGTYVNHASVTSAAEDPEPANNYAEAAVSVLAKPAVRTRLTLRARVNVPATMAGEMLRYQLVVGNAGGSAAEHVVVCDLLPRHTTVVNRGGGHLDAGRVCFKLASLAAHSAHTFRLLLRADSTAIGRIVNRGTATASDVREARAHVATPVRGGTLVHRESGVTG